MNLAIISCLHGIEPFGTEVINRLKKLNIKGLGFFIANERALKQGKRFIDVDLNRCFPGNQNSKNYEERVAYELLKKLKNYDYVIDLHSSSSNTPSIVIITKKTEDNINLAINTGVEKICFMNSDLASGKALIDHVKSGISIEAGNHNDKDLVNKTYNYIINVLIYLKLLKGDNKVFNPKFYEIIGLEKDMNLKLKDFEKYNNYYPVLVDEKSYVNIKCLKAKKTDIKILNKVIVR